MSEVIWHDRRDELAKGARLVERTANEGKPACLVQVVRRQVPGPEPQIALDQVAAQRDIVGAHDERDKVKERMSHSRVSPVKDPRPGLACHDIPRMEVAVDKRGARSDLVKSLAR